MSYGEEVKKRVANTKMSHLNTGVSVYVFPSVFLVSGRLCMNTKIIEIHNLLKHVWFGGLGVG